MKQFQINIDRDFFQSTPSGEDCIHIGDSFVCVQGGSQSQRYQLLESMFKGRGGISIHAHDSMNNLTTKQWAHSKNSYLKKNNGQGFYFQQRFQSAFSDSSDTVGRNLSMANEEHPYSELENLVEVLELSPLWDKSLIHLSSGEWQRFVIGQQIILQPQVIIAPDVLKGLDIEWQRKVLDLFSDIEFETPFLVFSLDEKDGSMAKEKVIDLATFSHQKSDEWKMNLSELFDQLPVFVPITPGTSQIEMKGVHIQYGKSTILDDIQWAVISGQRWRISGPNGSGKSTLLSLIYGDVPQAYSEPIYFFGVKKGQGQTIWELKSKISYFSSDQFVYFQSFKTGLQIIYQQLKTPYIKIEMPKEDTIRQIARFFGVEKALDITFQRMNPVIRRQILLIGLYLKDSEILILDEPYHEFEVDRIQRNNQFLTELLNRSNRTLLFVTHLTSYLPEGITQEFNLQKKYKAV